MKQAIMNLLILIMSISLVTGCSTNTQSQNTGIGAVTGAVIGGLAGSAIGGGAGQAIAIGVGAVAGALVGGYVGKNMDSSDTVKSTSTLEKNTTNSSTHWTNSNTHATYTMTPISGHFAYKGYSNCRKFRMTTTYSNGKKYRSYGVACRQSNGSWITVK